MSTDAPATPGGVDPEPAPTPPPRRWVRRLFRRAATILGVLYLGVTLVLYALQTRLVFAAADSQGRPEYVVRPEPGCTLLSLRSPRDEPIAAVFGPALTPDGRPHPDAHHRPTLLFFYGNGMTLRDAQHDLQRLRRLGANVLIPEYLGYGMSGGKPTEQGCYDTADAAYDHLRGRSDIAPDRLVVGGWSLGGAVAIDLAARRPAAGLFAMSTFTSMVDMAGRMFPFLPTSLLLHHRFESRAKIGRVTVPILIGHGTADPVVPAVMTRQLAEAATSSPRVESFTIPGAGHNDVFEIGADETFRRLGRFFDALAERGAEAR